MAENCCLALDKSMIYLLDAYANGSSGYGYGNSYGTVYGTGSTAVNPISPFDVGRELGVASATLAIEAVDINSSINNFNAYSGRKIKGINLAISTECWSRENLRLFLGAEITTVSGSSVTEYLYRQYIPAETAIVKNGTLTNVVITNTSTSAVLVSGIDYLVYLNRITFIKDINVTTSLTLSYVTSPFEQITPFKDTNIDFKAIKIAGINIADNKFVTLIFPKVKINPDSINYDIFADEFIPINLTAKCYDGYIQGMSSPAPFQLIRGV